MFALFIVIIYVTITKHMYCIPKSTKLQLKISNVRFPDLYELHFLHSHKMSEMKNLKARKFILPSSFRDFSPWLIDSMVWRPAVKQATWLESKAEKITSVIVVVSTKCQCDKI